MPDIVIAFGCQIRDVKYHGDLVTYLNKIAKSTGTSVWSYPPAGPTRTIELVYTKAEFAAALDKKDAIVVYDGHSRIGQGPAFGPAKLPECPDKATYPTNPWDDSFRMGFDLADIDCIGDIIHHGTSPKEYALPPSSKGVFASRGQIAILDGAIAAGKAKCSKEGAWRELKVCYPKAANTANCRKETPLANRHYFKAHTGGIEFDTLVAVGDADLVKTSLACAVLFMNSCSSKRHFYPALQRHKKAVKSGCTFYVTAEVCSAATSIDFLKAVLAGKDPVKDAKGFLKTMNGRRGSGFISVET